ncbi:MAG: DNA glycosylase [Nitrososphaeraceae archaeon]
MPYDLFSENLFNPEITINSGQMFLWEKHDNSWYGTYGNHILKISPDTAVPLDDNSSSLGYKSISGRKIHFESFPEMHNWHSRVFRFDDDISKILSDLSTDAVLARTIRRGYGLRIMRQEPCQCIVSFVCSSNTNISMIRKMLKNLSKKYGRRINLDGRDFFTFPSIKSLHKADINELRSCGVGYRAKGIKAAAKSIVEHELEISNLLHKNYYDAKKELLNIYGIGNKIADCILLFSLEKLEAFPIDIWIARALDRYYKWLFSINGNNNVKPDCGLTPVQYHRISERMRQYFGKYSGYAQQYLYYYIRENENQNW